MSIDSRPYRGCVEVVQTTTCLNCSTGASAQFIDPEVRLGPSADLDAVSRFCLAASRSSMSDLIPNNPASMLTLQLGSRAFPVTVNSGHRNGSYVVQPHTAYVGYPLDEIRQANLGVWAPCGKAALHGVGKLLRLAGMCNVVLLDNFCIATNLHGDWNGEGIPAITQTLSSRFPNHLIGIRSVDPWTCPKLFAALKNHGWLMLPARQVWVVDDMERDWATRNHVKTDRRLFRKSKLLVEDVEELSPQDANRIAKLYKSLYLEKYSDLNPDFSSAWVRLLHDSALVRFRVARDSHGLILAFVGCLERSDVLTAPLIGYDRTCSRRAGLYRIANLMLGDYAKERGLRLNGSSGAGEFKRLRGAKGKVDYLACAIDHLPASKRNTLRIFASAMERLVVPFLASSGL